MENRAIRVLTVDPDGSLAPRIAGALGEAEDGAGLRLESVSSTSRVGAAGDGEPPDVVLLPLPLAGRDGVLPALELRSAAPDVPVVVVCEPDHEPLALKAVQLGASDYLLSDRLFGTLVSRCLLHAVELARMRTLLARREAEWPASLRPGTGVRAASLRRAAPRVFEELVAEYGEALDLAVAQITHRVEHRVEARVRRLARRAAELRASPRDVVEIHTAAMKPRQRREGPQRSRLYHAEGRVRLLELMGHLATYYRDASLAPPLRRGRSEPGEP